MKTLILFLFTCITYVFSELTGPLGFAAKMPPYELSGSEYGFKNDSLRGTYDFKDLVLFLTQGKTDCKALLHACVALKRLYGNNLLLQGAYYTCRHGRRFCALLPQIKAELCDFTGFDYKPGSVKAQLLDSKQCFDFYIKCRLRSNACSPIFRDRCRKILALCHYNYREYKLIELFISLLGDDYESPTFLKNLKEACSDLYHTSDQFVQLCLNPDFLISKMKFFKELQKKKLEDFYNYPDLSSGALVDARELDGGLFSPRTDLGIDSTYFMGFLVGQYGISFDFKNKCDYTSKKCLGLGFFPQSAYFCNPESKLPKGDNCKKAENFLLNQEVPRFKDEIINPETKPVHVPGMVFASGIKVKLCLKYLGPCSFLKKLDSLFDQICQILERRCAYELEIGSAISIFEASLRGFVPKEKPPHKTDPCEERLREICPKILNQTVDSLIFCLTPPNTCQTLRELYKLRCHELKEALANPNPNENECVRRVDESNLYKSYCSLNEEYRKYTQLCHSLYPDNRFLEDDLNDKGIEQGEQG